MLGTPACISISIILFYIFLRQRQRKQVFQNLTPEVDPPIIIIVVESRKVMQWSRMPVSKLTLSQGGATTLSIMTLKKMSCSILSLSIMTLKRKNVKKWETQYYIMLSSVMLSVFMQNIIKLSVVASIIFSMKMSPHLPTNFQILKLRHFEENRHLWVKNKNLNHFHFKGYLHVRFQEPDAF
jgi:hypothetical protein